MMFRTFEFGGILTRETLHIQFGDKMGDAMRNLETLFILKELGIIWYPDQWTHFSGVAQLEYNFLSI